MKGERITSISGLNYLWKVENLYLAGQPSPESWSEIKELGISKVINLRNDSEMDFSAEISDVKKMGLSYEQFPIVENGQLNAANCKKLSDMINKEDSFLIHCGSANRVGGWLITYLTQYCNIDFEEAVEIASENGLSNPGFIDQAKAICNL